MMTEISLGFSGCIIAGRSMDENKDLKIAISLLKRNNCKSSEHCEGCKRYFSW